MKTLIKRLVRRFNRSNNFFIKHALLELINKQNPIFVDIGAYDGSEIDEIFDCWKSARVYAFEIDPYAANLFQKKWASELKNQRVSLFKQAISNITGNTVFYASDRRFDDKYGFGVRWTMSGSIRKPKLHLDKWKITFAEPALVESIRLDDWHEEHLGNKCIDLVYADVNGGEQELIEGGINTLQSYTRFFYTEYFDEEIYEDQPNKDWILKTLTNFELVKIIGHNMLLRNTKLNR